MGLVEFITKLFGNKSQKDMREIMPYVEKIKVLFEEIDALSNDDLRARSAALMARIQERVADKKARIVELKANIEDLEIDKREKVYNEVDHIDKDIKAAYEDVLREILPEAFAIFDCMSINWCFKQFIFQPKLFGNLFTTPC